MKLSDIRHFFKSFSNPKKNSAGCQKEKPKINLVGKNIDRVLSEHDHPGSSQRQYRVYLPKGYTGEDELPLVMVLHGCDQTHIEIQTITDFDRLADENNFILVYPYVTRYDDMRMSNCWGWWRPEHINAGGGEVEDLWCIVREVASEFSVDLNCVHLAGLSSGAGMAVAALTVHAGRFVSAAVIAGVSYHERVAVTMPIASLRSYRPVETTVKLMENASPEGRVPTPLFIVHSESDRVVDIQASKNLRDSWLSYFGLSEAFVKKIDHYQSRGVSWTHTGYGRLHERNLVETVFLSGVGHGWYGGRPGDYSFPDGPPISELMWQFFSEQEASAVEVLAAAS